MGNVLAGKLTVILDEFGHWEAIVGGSQEGWATDVSSITVVGNTLTIVVVGEELPPAQAQVGQQVSLSVANQIEGTYVYTFENNIVESPVDGTLFEVSFYNPEPIDPNKIDREQLLLDASLWLPQGNALTQEEMLRIAELVISAVGDDVKNYPEILCKFLGAVANVNIGKASVDAAGISKEKLGDHEITYGGVVDYAKVWSEFKDNLDNICPLFGYKVAKSKSAAKINAGERYNPLYC